MRCGSSVTPSPAQNVRPPSAPARTNGWCPGLDGGGQELREPERRRSWPWWRWRRAGSCRPGVPRRRRSPRDRREEADLLATRGRGASLELHGPDGGIGDHAVDAGVLEARAGSAPAPGRRPRPRRRPRRRARRARAPDERTRVGRGARAGVQAERSRPPRSSLARLVGHGGLPPDAVASGVGSVGGSRSGWEWDPGEARTRSGRPSPRRTGRAIPRVSRSASCWTRLGLRAGGRRRPDARHRPPTGRQERRGWEVLLGRDRRLGSSGEQENTAAAKASRPSLVPDLHRVEPVSGHPVRVRGDDRCPGHGDDVRMTEPHLGQGRVGCRHAVAEGVRSDDVGPHDAALGSGERDDARRPRVAGCPRPRRWCRC